MTRYKRPKLCAGCQICEFRCDHFQHGVTFKQIVGYIAQLEEENESFFHKNNHLRENITKTDEKI